MDSPENLVAPALQTQLEDLLVAVAATSETITLTYKPGITEMEATQQQEPAPKKA